MKRILVIIYAALLSIYGPSAFATAGQLFNVRPAPSGLITNIAGIALQINTTIPAKTYQFAGIHIKTPGYEVLPNLGTQCTMAPNGYCLFSVSDTSAATLIVSIPFAQTLIPNKRIIPLPPISILMTLCLNAKGNTMSCEDHTISQIPPV